MRSKITPNTDSFYAVYSCHVDLFYLLQTTPNCYFNDLGQQIYVQSTDLLSNVYTATCNLLRCNLQIRKIALWNYKKRSFLLTKWVKVKYILKDRKEGMR